MMRENLADITSVDCLNTFHIDGSFRLLVTRTKEYQDYMLRNYKKTQ